MARTHKSPSPTPTRKPRKRQTAAALAEAQLVATLAEKAQGAGPSQPEPPLPRCEHATVSETLRDADMDVAQEAEITPVEPEAQASDAALPDAALPDAALPDAALPDAALPDAALPDAALPDAALPDADARVTEQDLCNPDNTAAWQAELATHNDDDMRPVATWTAAPSSYDGFGTVTVLEDCGLYAGRTIRQVETPLQHLHWQRGRYESGMYPTMGHSDWLTVQQSAGVVQDKASTPDAALCPAALINAAAEAERRAAIREVPQASATPPQHPVPARFHDHVTYLVALVEQGVPAIQQALAQGRVRVRVPRATTAPHAPTSANGLRAGRKMDPEKVRAFRQRRAEGADLETLATTYEISLLLAKNIDKGLRWGSVI